MALASGALLIASARDVMRRLMPFMEAGEVARVMSAIQALPGRGVATARQLRQFVEVMGTTAMLADNSLGRPRNVLADTLGIPNQKAVWLRRETLARVCAELVQRAKPPQQV